MIKKLGHMIEGWGKRFGWFSVTPAEKKLADLRMSICKKCTHSRSSKILKILNGNAAYEDQLQCGRCKCPCLEKGLVVDESCPEQKW